MRDLLSKDTSTKELVKPVAAKEVAQVSKVRSGGSAQAKSARSGHVAASSSFGFVSSSAAAATSAIAASCSCGSAGSLLL